eukprot:2395644-Rhodomonas_salina.1
MPQTGSGKTHSVYGSGGRPDVDQAAADMGLAVPGVGWGWGGGAGRVVQYLIRAGKGLASTTEGVSYRYSLSLGQLPYWPTRAWYNRVVRVPVLMLRCVLLCARHTREFVQRQLIGTEGAHRVVVDWY